MTSNNIRKVKTTVDNLYLEKQKLEKGDKPKKGKGGAKGKARLRVEGDNVSKKFLIRFRHSQFFGSFCSNFKKRN